MAFLIDQLSSRLAHRREWKLHLPFASMRRTASDRAARLLQAVRPSLRGGPRRARGARIATDAGETRRLAHDRRTGSMIEAGLMAVAGGALVAGALMGSGAMLAARQAEVVVATPPAPPQAWSEVIRPIPIYDLGGTDFAKLPRTYQARRHAPDGAREDVMSFGTPGDGKPYLRIVLVRRGEGGPSPMPPSLADALARQAGMVADTATQFRTLPPIETRFGALERADFMLWKGSMAMACRGFRGLPNGGNVLGLAGFACGTVERPLEANAVACVADRIDLLSAGDDRPLRALFVAAERRPGAAACGEGVLATSLVPASAPGPFAALRRRAAWLESGLAGPPLRGALDATDDER